MRTRSNGSARPRARSRSPRSTLAGSTTDLVERIRTEQSVLLVSGEMFGIDNGIRFGFGYDIDHTLKGLSKVDDLLT